MRVSAADDWNIFQHNKRNFVSLGGHVIVVFITQIKNEVPNHFTGTVKGAIYYVTVAKVIFSHVKITCFHM